MRLRRIDSPPGFPGQPCALRERGPTGARWVRGFTSSPWKRGLDELCESAGAVADFVLFRGIHLAESERTAGRYEHRVIAEASIAPRRPDQVALDLAAEQLDMDIAGIGPGEG